MGIEHYAVLIAFGLMFLILAGMAIRGIYLMIRWIIGKKCSKCNGRMRKHSCTCPVFDYYYSCNKCGHKSD